MPARLQTAEKLSHRPPQERQPESARHISGWTPRPIVSTLVRVDPLSEALRGLPMSGCLIARADLTAPWGIVLEPYPAAVFHVILTGSCWLEPAGSRPVRLEAGDIAVLMRGQSHQLRSDRDVVATAFSDLLRHCIPGKFPVVHIDSGGERAAMLCGFFNFDRQTTHPLLRALPDVIHVNAFGDAAPLSSCRRNS